MHSFRVWLVQCFAKRSTGQAGSLTNNLLTSKITSVRQSNFHLHRQCWHNLSQRPTLGADLICIHRRVTSRKQGTFSREKERGPWERGCSSSTSIALKVIRVYNPPFHEFLDRPLLPCSPVPMFLNSGVIKLIVSVYTCVSFSVVFGVRVVLKRTVVERRFDNLSRNHLKCL